MNNIKVDRVGRTRFVSVPGVGVGMYAGLTDTSSGFGFSSKT